MATASAVPDHLGDENEIEFSRRAVGEGLVALGYCHFPYIRVRTLKQARTLLSLDDSRVTVVVSNRLITINLMISHRDIRKLTVE